LSTFKLVKVDERIFNPATVKQSTSGKPGAQMDR
jgi:hypothetical protein